jgi:hypothetical protein
LGDPLLRTAGLEGTVVDLADLALLMTFDLVCLPGAFALTCDFLAVDLPVFAIDFISLFLYYIIARKIRIEISGL